jgi:acyl dehydratase
MNTPNAPGGRSWESLQEGDRSDDVVLDIPLSRFMQLVSATWDYFPGHHDVEYAQSQGHPTVFLNTYFLAGFLDRVALDFLGPGWFLRKRRVRMQAPSYADDVLTGVGTVDRCFREGGERLVSMTVTVSTGQGVTCVGMLELSELVLVASR